MLIDFSALVVIDAALRRSAVSNLVSKDRVITAKLAASDMFVHAAVKVVADSYVNGFFSLGVKNTVFTFDIGNLARIVGIKRGNLGGSAGFIKRHTFSFLSASAEYQTTILPG